MRRHRIAVLFALLPLAASAQIPGNYYDTVDDSSSASLRNTLGALLATNYVYVMWNRVALMEGSMVAFMVASWYAYVRAQTQPLWGIAAAGFAVLAFFTKAAAVFFVAALGADALLLFLWPLDRQARRAAIATLAGLAGVHTSEHRVVTLKGIADPVDVVAIDWRSASR